MQPQVSIIIAVAPYHQDIASNAIAAASLQTVPVMVITAFDEKGHGAGAARNAALSRVETDFTVFLDADDAVATSFVERCLQAWKPNHYVFTDWTEGAASKTAPDCPWVNKTWHPITALIPTDWLRKVGGFDETLEGAEDSDLFLKLTTAGCCGIHLPEPLFHYGAGGQRSKRFIQSPAYNRVMELFSQKYGSKQMSCCGDNAPVVQSEPEGLPGDVLVQAVWAGNRHERGSISGRLYPRTGNGALMKVDPRDQRARPDLWRLVEKTPALARRPVAVIERAEPAARMHIPAPVHGVVAVAEQLWGIPAPLSLNEMLAIAPAVVKPDVGALARLTGVA